MTFYLKETDMTAPKTTKKRTTAKSRKKEEWTIPEFQMWFRTALDLQGDDWYPTEDQWEIVLDMVFKLKERQPRPQPTYPQAPYNPTQHNRAPSPVQHMTVGVPGAPIAPLQGQPDMSSLDSQMMQLIPPSNDPLPPGADNIEELRRQSELGLGVVSGSKVIPSAGNFGA